LVLCFYEVFFLLGLANFAVIRCCRISIDSPDYSYLANDFYKVEVIVVPMWGLYANFFAQVMSQISSHFIVMYHRRIIRHGKAKYMERHHPQRKSNLVVEPVETSELLPSSLSDDERKDQLSKYNFTRPHKEEGAKLVARRPVNFLLPFGSVLLAILLFFCCLLPSMKLETYGVVGFLLRLGEEFQVQAVKYQSIFSISKILIDQAIYLNEWEHYVGMAIFAIMNILTLLVVPILTLLAMMYIWFVPMTRKRREIAAVTLEYLQAWQYVEVYMLAVVIDSW